MAKRAVPPGEKTGEPDKRKKGKLANLNPERHRRIYLTYRMPELVAALENLERETRALKERLEDPALAKGSPERSKAMQRLIYLRDYRPVLKMELASLKDEHKKLAKEKH